MSSLLERYASVLDEVRRSAVAAGRSPDDVVLLPVSKTVGADAIRELYQSGVRRFAENREPVLMAKCAGLPDDIEWHFIGPLQSNKVRKVVSAASVIHSVDSIPLVERLDRISGEENRSPRYMLEVNVSGEASKGGFPVGELPAAAAVAAKTGNARFVGLMTMAPLGAGHDELMRIFGALRSLRDELAASLGIDLPELSMGMSGDFREAIACGATMVRIGTSIFAGV
ncbi:MAG: YggS family pyridoxal phosphate-dependent enzyme [Victivallaceae bacterium]|nr:YggS family pyridoxal phosphate-dependent enzyme [Victivallaceae bacterium]